MENGEEKVPGPQKNVQQAKGKWLRGVVQKDQKCISFYLGFLRFLIVVSVLFSAPYKSSQIKSVGQNN